MDAKVYEVPLASGETVLVQPVSPFLRQMFYEQAKRLHPDPDPEPYRKPLANAFDPDLKEAADDNPEYVQARARAGQKQLFALGEMVIRAGVVIGVKGEVQAETLARYAAKLASVQALVADLPEDDWLACVMSCLITSHEDVALIRDASNELLTQEDIERAAASFRRHVQRRSGVATHQTPRTSRVPKSTG